MTQDIENLIVDQELSRELICNICLHIVSSSRQCTNGHLFCKECIETHLNSQQANKSCPCCRVYIRDSTHLAKNMFADNRKMIMQVYCSFRFTKTGKVDPEGCKEVLCFKDLEAHLHKCPYAFIECPNNCTTTLGIRRQQMNQHLAICTFRKVVCEHCQKPYRHFEIENHLNVCSKFPVKCGKCAETMHRDLAQTHPQHCPEEAIPCPYRREGCQKQGLLRKELEKHLVAEIHSHLLILKNFFGKELQLFSKQFSAPVPHTFKKEPDFRIQWKIENFRAKSSKSQLKSAAFIFEDFSWSFTLILNKSSPHKCSQIILSIDKDSSGKEVDLICSVRLGTNGQLNLVKEFSQTFPDPSGERRIDLVPCSNLLDSLDNDKLIIEFQFSVQKISFFL